MPLPELLAEESKLHDELSSIREEIDNLKKLEDRLQQQAKMQAHAVRLEAIQRRFVQIQDEIKLQALIPNVNKGDLSRAEGSATGGIGWADDYLFKLQIDMQFARVLALRQEAAEIIECTSYLKNRFASSQEVKDDLGQRQQAQADIERLKAIANEMNEAMQSVAAQKGGLSDSFGGMELFNFVGEGERSVVSAIKPVMQFACALVVEDCQSEIEQLGQKAANIHADSKDIGNQVTPTQAWVAHLKTPYDNPEQAPAAVSLTEYVADQEQRTQERARLEQAAADLFAIDSKLRGVSQILLAEGAKSRKYGFADRTSEAAQSKCLALSVQTYQQAGSLREKSRTGKYEEIYLREQIPGYCSLMQLELKELLRMPVDERWRYKASQKLQEAINGVISFCLQDAHGSHASSLELEQRAIIFASLKAFSDSDLYLPEVDKSRDFIATVCSMIKMSVINKSEKEQFDALVSKLGGDAGASSSVQQQSHHTSILKPIF